LKPTQIHENVAVVQADEEGGLFEGRSEEGHRLRRFGGYGLLDVTPDEAKILNDPMVDPKVKKAIIDNKFELVDPSARPTQDTYGLKRLIGGACMNVLQDLPDSLDGYRVNRHKAVHVHKEFPRPKV
jgi:hypothetical protein